MLALLLAALASAPLHAKTSVYSGPKAEDKLRRFVESDAGLQTRFADAAQREEIVLAEIRESGLRDAVSDMNHAALPARVAEAAPGAKAKLIEQLPGLRSPEAGSCPTLAECAAPELAMDVPDARALPESVRRLVRPWLLLQQARGARLDLEPAHGHGDALLTVRLAGVDAPVFTLNVAPRLLGGFKVWFDQPMVLATIYGRERDAVLGRR